MQINHNNKIYNIRLIDRRDVDFLINLRNDPVVYDNLGTHVFLNSILQDEFIISISKSEKAKYFIFEDENKNRIGLIRMTEIDRVNRSVCVGADICKEFRGKGLARLIYDAIFKIAFDAFGMNRVWLSVLEENNIAYDLYNKIGFTKEGVQRNAIFKNGEFKNYILMSILFTEYKENKKN